jgi:serine/threonine protein kinase
VDPSGGRIYADKVYITDYGIQHQRVVIDPNGQSILIPGTVPYVAPEIFREGRNALSPASDIWALGCMGYEFITRRRLFENREQIGAYEQTGVLNLSLIPSQLGCVHTAISACLKLDRAQRCNALQFVTYCQQQPLGVRTTPVQLSPQMSPQMSPQIYPQTPHQNSPPYCKPCQFVAHSRKRSHWQKLEGRFITMGYY